MAGAKRKKGGGAQAAPDSVGAKQEKKARKREVRRKLLRESAIAAPFCMVMALAFPTANIWPLAFFMLAGLAWRLRYIQRPRHALFVGFVFATAGNAVGYYWIPELLMRFGHIPFAAAVPIFLIFAAYQGMVFGLWAALVVWIRESTKLPLWITGAPLLVALEISVPQLFPWALGETQWLNRWLAQSADLFGVFGISLVIMQFNMMVEETAWRRWLAPHKERGPWPTRLIAVTLGVVVALHLYGAWRVSEVDARVAVAPTLRVAMIQPNIGIFSKHEDMTGPKRLERLIELSRRAEEQGADLIVWPEASFPGALLATRTWIPPRGSPYLRGGVTKPIIIGTLRAGEVDPVTGRRPRTNSMVLVSPATCTGPTGETPCAAISHTYDKNYLVWFSEKIPYSDYFPWINKVLPYSANFTYGDGVPLWTFQGYSLAPNICFEDTLPRWTSKLPGAPHLIVNSTEDAWFGDTTEPWFHLAFATFRSIETHSAMVRAVNTGPSSVVDPAGRVVTRTNVFEEAVLVYDVPMIQGDTLYRRFGDWLAFGCLFGALGLAGFAVFRGRQARRAGASSDA